MKVRLRHRQLARRLAQGRLSQNAWAHRIGVSRGHLSNLANGNRPYPSPQTRAKLLRSLELEFDELFEVEIPHEEMTPTANRHLFRGPEIEPEPNLGRKEMVRVWKELWADLRYGVRTVRRNPGFCLVAVATLALAIGANTVIFSAMEAFVLRLPNYPTVESLREVRLDLPAGSSSITDWSYPLFDDFRRRLPNLLKVAAYTENPRNYNLASGDRPLPVQVEFVSPNYFTLLAVAPARGRSLNTLPADETSVAMLSHTIAESLFGPASDPLGQTIELNTVHLTVVGVMPPGFRGLSDAADIWVPMAQAAQLMFARRLVVPFAFWHQVLLQIPSGMSSQELASILQSASQGTSEQFNIPSVFAGATMRTRAIELGEHRRDRDLESSLVVLFAAVGLVLLVACANLANLLLVRAAHREREISLRASIGAGGFRIFRQLLTEAAVLGLLGAGLALCLAKGGIEIVEALKPPAIAGSSSSEPLQVNLSVLGFTLGLSLLATLLFGIAPALRACRSDLIQALRGQTSGPAHSSGYLRSGLVVAEIALATVLLVGAGLLLQSLGNLLGQQVGFAQDFLAARIDLPSKAYSESQSRLFYEELLAKARALPGVESASLANCLPIESGCDRTSLRIAGDPSETGNPYSTWVQMIDENFLSDLKIPLLAGRGVNAEDRAGAPLIAVVNQKAASEYWPDRNPLGERIRPAIGFPEGQFAEVVGVVGNTKDRGLGAKATAGIYLSFRQISYRSNFLFLKGSQPAQLAGPLRTLVQEIDPRLAMWDTRPLGEFVGQSAAQSRFRALLLGSFAGLALVLSLIGIYGVTSFAVAMRSRELAIRKAFGARRRQLLQMVLWHGMSLVGLGILVGLAGSLGLTRFLTSMLFGISAGDGWTLLITLLLITLTSLAACYIPARRATQLDPIDCLRCD